MKQQEVFKKIGGIIREINEQYEYLQNNAGALNDLELELLLANAHFLADHIEVLRKLNRQAENTAPVRGTPVSDPEPVPQPVIPITQDEPVVPTPEPRYFEPEVQRVIRHEPIIEEPAPTIEFEVPAKTAITEVTEPADALPFEPETIRHELTMEDIGEDWDEEPEEDEAEETYNKLNDIMPEPVIAPVAEPEPVKKEVEPQPQIDVEEQIITLNQKMSAQMATSRMSDHLGAQSVTDLKSAISLNDKLLYIKDLFNGYSLAYSEAIDILNRFKTFEEAEKFLQSSYAVKNNWADKQTTVDKFYELLKRRYV